MVVFPIASYQGADEHYLGLLIHWVVTRLPSEFVTPSVSVAGILRQGQSSVPCSFVVQSVQEIFVTCPGRGGASAIILDFQRGPGSEKTEAIVPQVPQLLSQGPAWSPATQLPVQSAFCSTLLLLDMLYVPVMGQLPGGPRG